MHMDITQQAWTVVKIFFYNVKTQCQSHAYCIRRFPKVWSSLAMVKIAALDTLVSFAIVILQEMWIIKKILIHDKITLNKADSLLLSI